ncbi:phosphoribosylamine--glycine ligase [Patescibacteria group bacterium]|nr:phosphoribosylamine--glycine ligase [Patescibacteria group bacterium]
MKRILLVGNGAREHVIAETLKRSPQEVLLYTYASSKNPGIIELSEEYEVGSLSDFDAMISFAEKVKPDFAFVGPDNPIADGAADKLLEIGVKSVAPTMMLAQLESSKSFTRDLMKKYNIPGNPEFRVFEEIDGMRDFIEELGGNYVVKADGLTGGKGVKVSGVHLESIEEGVQYAEECILDAGRVVIEEKFVGEEFSLMSLTDGKTLRDMPAVQDHKRAYEGDTGPNTGGMGTYSDVNHSLPFLRESDLKEAHEITVRVAAALKEETGKYFTGVMYGGFIAVKDGVRLIEYNARFGDPEAMNVLPLLKSDFAQVCEAIIEGTLEKLELEFENKATVLKYVVPEGYPVNPKKGDKIEIGMVPEGVKMYFGSVDKKEDGLYLSSSRAIAFVGIADSLEEAERKAQSALDCVKGPVFYRRDIGTAALIQKRIDHMTTLRG